MIRFPDNFLWGVATSAYQIEGAAREDGKGPSVWDTFTHTPGVVRDGTNGDVACDSYHRYPDDVRCMTELGVGAYRFSISWPRVQPDGRGPLNPPGLDYYARLIDLLLENGIEPWITLYHWDLPQPLEDEGGWRTRKLPPVFADYAAEMVRRYGDRVKHWITFNEIHAFVDQGYHDGSKAPGLRLPLEELPQIYHHVLLAHGLAVQAMREAAPGLSIGTAENPRPAVPVIETPENVRAAEIAWDHDVGFLLQPMVAGAYPEGLDGYPEIREGDMETIAQPLDFIGLNLYSGAYVEAAPEPPGFRRIPIQDEHPGAATETWIRFLPEAMYWAARHTHTKYDPPAIYFMENGFPTAPEAPEQTDRNDTSRIMYLRTYLAQLARAIDEGHPVRGYFCWSLMDSFEWIKGHTARFGLYHVDWETQVRSPRLSARWYAETIRRNALA